MQMSVPAVIICTQLGTVRNCNSWVREQQEPEELTPREDVLIVLQLGGRVGKSRWVRSLNSTLPCFLCSILSSLFLANECFNLVDNPHLNPDPRVLFCVFQPWLKTRIRSYTCRDFLWKIIILKEMKKPVDSSIQPTSIIRSLDIVVDSGLAKARFRNNSTLFHNHNMCVCVCDDNMSITNAVVTTCLLSDRSRVLFWCKECLSRWILWIKRRLLTFLLPSLRSECFHASLTSWRGHRVFL